MPFGTSYHAIILTSLMCWTMAVTYRNFPLTSMFLLVLGMAKPHHVSEPIMFILEPYFQCFCLCTLKFPVIINIWCKLFLDPIGPMIPGDWVLMQLAHAQNSPLVDKTSPGVTTAGAHALPN